MRARLPVWGPDALAVAALAGLALIFFWPVTLNLGWVPRGGGDLVSLLWPNYAYAARALWSGRIPLWNSSVFSGAPFAADNQTSLFYPINLLTFLAAPSMPYAAMEWLVVFHIWLAGVSMYWLMRVLLAAREPDRQAGARLPALLAAVAYMFSDVFITHIGNLNLNAVAAWLPAAFGTLHLALARRSASWALAAGVVGGLTVLAGHAQMTFVVALGLALYVAWELAGALWREARAAERIREFLRLAALAALVGLVAAGVGAISLLPTLELTRYTSRVRLNYAAAAAYSIPWAGLAGLFSPLVFGRGPAGFWGPWDRVELGYLGVLPLFFAGLAPFRGRNRLPLFMALLGGLALLAALGGNAPLHRWLYDLVPGLSGMRVPARFILLTDFSLAALAGYGLHAIARVSARRLGGWGAALAIVAAAVIASGYNWAAAVAGASHATALWLGLGVSLGLIALGSILTAALRARREMALGLAAVGLLAADLISQGAWVEVDHNDPTLPLTRPAVVAFLQGQPGPTRIESTSGAFVPSAVELFGLEGIGGVNHALVLAAYQTYLDGLGPRGAGLYNFLNAQFVVADKGQPPGDSSLVPVYADDPALDVYLNTNAMARVSLVYTGLSVPDGEAAFAAIHAPDFDPTRQVVVEAGPSLVSAPADGANLYYLQYRPESFAVVAATTAPAYLVFSEVWYPGWQAWVDGQPAPIYRANFAFRAVYLPNPGEHVVEMRFEPGTLQAGAAITAVTVLGLAGYAGLRARRRRPGP